MLIGPWSALPLLGKEPVEVTAVGSRLVDPSLEQYGDFDTVMVNLRPPQQVVAVYGYDQRIEVFGSTGMVLQDNLRPTTIRRWSRTATGAREPLLNFFLERYQQAYKSELERKASRYDDLRPWYRKDPRLRLPGHYSSTHLRPGKGYPVDVQRPTAWRLRRQSTADPSSTRSGLKAAARRTSSRTRMFMRC